MTLHCIASGRPLLDPGSWLVMSATSILFLCICTGQLPFVIPPFMYMKRFSAEGQVTWTSRIHEFYSRPLQASGPGARHTCSMQHVGRAAFCKRLNNICMYTCACLYVHMCNHDVVLQHLSVELGDSDTYILQLSASVNNCDWSLQACTS